MLAIMYYAGKETLCQGYIKACQNTVETLLTISYKT